MDLEKQQASLSHQADQMYQVVISWTIGSAYNRRTEGRRYTIVRPVKDERKKIPTAEQLLYMYIPWKEGWN